MKVYFATPIDFDKSRGEDSRQEFAELVKDCGYEVCGAGFGDSPIINVDSGIEEKEKIVDHDLNLLKESDIMLIVTDMKTPGIGTWMEAMQAKNWGKQVIVYAKCDKVSNVYLEVFADKIICNSKEELVNTLTNLNILKIK